MLVKICYTVFITVVYFNQVSISVSDVVGDILLPLRWFIYVALLEGDVF